MAENCSGEKTQKYDDSISQSTLCSWKIIIDYKHISTIRVQIDDMLWIMTNKTNGICLQAPVEKRPVGSIKAPLSLEKWTEFVVPVSTCHH